MIPRGLLLDMYARKRVNESDKLDLPYLAISSVLFGERKMWGSVKERQTKKAQNIYINAAYPNLNVHLLR
jgi:hypothetical protein